MWHNLVQSPPKSSAITRVDILNASIIIISHISVPTSLGNYFIYQTYYGLPVFLRDMILAATIFIGQERNSNV